MQTRWASLTLSVVVLLLLFSACGSSNPQAIQQTVPTSEGTAAISLTEEATPLPTTTPEPFSDGGPWEINFITADDATLYGILYGQGQTGIILAPTYPGGSEGWRPFAEEIAEQGYRVLTFDFRGQGKSEGDRSIADASTDLEAAITVLLENVADRVVLIGAGLGGMAAIQVAPHNEDVIGLVVISSPRVLEDLEIADKDLSDLDVPSLWLGTRNDMVHNVEDMYDISGSSDKELWIYEGSSLHGTFILEGADGPDLERRLLEFVMQVTGD
ncbi:MAG: alpha/beta fold hydrolase [Anaerolineae bacterium]|nr:alpha/beta fold hydrolase [Anaerolineae bacterium]